MMKTLANAHRLSITDHMMQHMTESCVVNELCVIYIYCIAMNFLFSDLKSAYFTAHTFTTELMSTTIQ